MCWETAEKFGKWPWEVYEQMPLEWLWFGQGLQMRRNEQQRAASRKGKQPRARRPTMGDDG